MSKIFGGLLHCVASAFRFIRKSIVAVWRWYKSLYREKKWWYKLIVFFLSMIVLAFLYVNAVMFNFLWLFGKSPTAHDIMHPENPEASIIYTADGKVMGKFFDENRQ